jgi:CHAT domain-containing protein
MSHHWKRRSAVLCTVAVFFCFSADGQQQSSSSAASSPIPTSVHPDNLEQSTSPRPATVDSTPLQNGNAVSDLAAQIDQLIKLGSDELYEKGQNKQAEQCAKEALELSQRADDKKRTLQALLLLEFSYYFQSRYQEALTVGEQALGLAQQLKDKNLLAHAFEGMAVNLRNLGRYEESLASFDQAMTLARELQDLPFAWALTRNVGVLYLETGEEEKAERALKEALRLAVETEPNGWRSQSPGLQAQTPQKTARASSLNALANWESSQENYAAAIEYLDQALAEKPENPGLAAEILNNEAFALEMLGESEKAIDRMQQAIKLWESAGNPPHPFMVAGLARSHESLGRFDEALAEQKKAMALLRDIGGSASYEWLMESRLAHIEHAMGNPLEALQHYQAAVRAIERLRPVGTESGRASLLAHQGRLVYAETADLLFELHRDGEALEMAEQGRARAFLDVLAESRTGVTDELTSDQRKREDAILARISSVQKELWNQNISAAEKKKNEAGLTSAEDELEKFHLEIRETNPHYASLQYPEPIHVQEIQSKLLDDHTALIEYLLGEKRSLAWVVTNDKVSTTILPARKEIEEHVAAYRELLGERVSGLTLDRSLTRINVLGGELYDLLFKPIEKDIRASKTLIVVPDGTLGYLPFEALVTTSGHSTPTYLAEKIAIVYGPSASALATVDAMNRQITPRRELLAFGDPVITIANGYRKTGSEPPSTESVSKLHRSSPGEDYAERGFSLARLPYTRDEVLGIGKFFPPDQRQLYLGADAREEAVKSEKLDDFRYIHFATHGFLDELHPGRSGILLSSAPESKEDGILQTGEIMRLKLNADIVTLSACSTGLGKLVTGEGVLGLTRAFFYAGARNVVVSLWNVNDSATATLMESFYLNLRRGLTKSEALHQAKLSIMHNAQLSWRHPYFWAAFVLEGQGH